MLISYALTADFLSSPWDWIGLYKVTWQAGREPISRTPPTGLSILSAHGSWAQRLQSYPHPPQGSLPIEGLAVKGKRQVV